MIHYFAEDGNYGNAESILIVHTENWTGEDWNKVLDSTDSERLQIAQQIAESRRTDKKLMLGL